MNSDPVMSRSIFQADLKEHAKKMEQNSWPKTEEEKLAEETRVESIERAREEFSRGEIRRGTVEDLLSEPDDISNPSEDRRFIASVAAMQGILSGSTKNLFIAEVAEMAVKFADALIAELNKIPTE